MSVADRRVLLETTVQVDRCKTAARREYVERLLKEFGLTFSTSLTLLEFKATIIQECITIYNQLRIDKAYTRARDRLIESNHRQHRLRAHIFNNLLHVNAPSSFDIDAEQDSKLAEKACYLLDVHIPRLYKWFVKSIDSVLDVAACTRANEAPTKKQVAYTPNLPICRRGHNKECRIEELIRANGPAVVQRLQTIEFESEQIDKAIQLVDKVCADASVDLSHGDCRRAGDFLISLEGSGFATHLMSTNGNEWAPLSKANDYDFIQITYPT